MTFRTFSGLALAAVTALSMTGCNEEEPAPAPSTAGVQPPSPETSPLDAQPSSTSDDDDRDDDRDDDDDDRDDDDDDRDDDRDDDDDDRDDDDRDDDDDDDDDRAAAPGGSVVNGTFVATIDGKPVKLSSNKLVCVKSPAGTTMSAGNEVTPGQAFSARFDASGKLSMLTVGESETKMLSYVSSTGTLAKSSGDGKHFEAEGTGVYVDVDNPSAGGGQKPFAITVDCKG